MTTHGTITERSVSRSRITPIGKGREGSGKWKRRGSRTLLLRVKARSASLRSMDHPSPSRYVTQCARPETNGEGRA